MIAGANQKGSPVSLNYQYVGPTYVTNAFGSTVAGPMWGQAMHAIQGMLKSTPFTPPNLSGYTAKYATVPSVSGMSVEQARAVLNQAGFRIAIFATNDVPISVVGTTYPKAGESAVFGRAVLLMPAPPKKHKPGRGGRGGGRGGGGGGGGGRGGGWPPGPR
ncbi:MAG: PASTA domain-containing protein [Nocardioides sp.]